MIEYKYNLNGGNLCSIKVNGIERQYQPMECSWTGQDVVIFPFIARLKDKTYTYKNNTYSLLNHGIARYNIFKLVKEDENSSTLLLESNEETKKIYPFDFQLFVTYTRDDNKLFVKYEVINIGNEKMYFGIGGHPAIKVNYENNDTKGNYVTFPKEIDFNYYSMDENAEFVNKLEHFGKIKQLEVNKAFFQKYKTLILDTNDVDEVTLIRKDNKKIKYCIKNRPYLALWSHPTCGDYVCVEPWDSLPDFIEGDKDITKKPTLKSLNPKEKYEYEYSMEFID